MELVVKAVAAHTALGLRAALRRDGDVDIEQRKVSGLERTRVDFEEEDKEGVGLEKADQLDKQDNLPD